MKPQWNTVAHSALTHDPLPVKGSAALSGVPTVGKEHLKLAQQHPRK
ncbi:hypothetical protein OK016_25565 [Vibrio chagasii]|nr:hypothetical protein [Vibrio chagasii]